VEHVATVRVNLRDTDAAGIVYYGIYLRWFEVGRAELMRRKGFSYLAAMERGILLPVIEAGARYHASARTTTCSVSMPGSGTSGSAPDVRLPDRPGRRDQTG